MATKASFGSDLPAVVYPDWVRALIRWAVGDHEAKFTTLENEHHKRFSEWFQANRHQMPAWQRHFILCLFSGRGLRGTTIMVVYAIGLDRGDEGETWLEALRRARR